MYLAANVIFGDYGLKILQFIVLLEHLLIQQLILLLQPDYLPLLFNNSILELLVLLLIIRTGPALLDLNPLDPPLVLLQLHTLQFILLQQHLIQFLVLLILVLKLDDLHLMILLLVLKLQMQVLVMPLCDLQRIFDGLDLGVEFVDV